MNTSLYRAIMIIMALLITNYLFSQSIKLGSWFVFNTEVHFDKKWNLFFEQQVRSLKPANNLFYHELKAGVAYSVSDNLSALLGTGQYVTYSPDGNFKSPVQSTEFRIWEQVQLNSNINRLKLEHRYRIEQRFFSTGFRNRFRCRLNTILPLNKAKITDHTIFATIYDELFLTGTNPIFETNRVSAGVGYVFNKYITIQAAGVRQFDLRKDRTTARRNFIQASLLFDIYYSKVSKKITPEITD